MDAPNTIELDGLTKHYGPVVGVTALSLAVRAGEVFGLLGPNGAGKTTTLRCLVGLLRSTGGRIRVLGLDPVADHPRSAPRLGCLPGELRFYPELTGEETFSPRSRALPRTDGGNCALGSTSPSVTRAALPSAPRGA
ncbi:hypothetical protein SNE510_63930 [Streptomyces sp. NE5-10]|nr:ATP-binding cassette domain-containing protein [Streptomyces sp. NE5-10]GHJ96874.1 hypothetical protein SNE510_63930 [Streptomyces sp. NE5-10]